MSTLEALILGIVQGMTEFLPVSSKSHLILIPGLFGWESPPIPYVVFLHAGTLVAALVYFWKEILETLQGLDRPGPGRKMLLLLVIATIPAAIVGFLFEKPLSDLFDDPALAAGLLIATGIILTTTERVFRSRPRDYNVEESSFSKVEKMTAEITHRKSLFIGTAQVLALLPGISRAGATIGAGLLAKLSRPQAATFSFMMSIPIIAGTIVAEIPKLLQTQIDVVPLSVGFTASLISGYFAIAGMIGYLQRRGLYPFAAYCFLVGPVAAFFLAR